MIKSDQSLKGELVRSILLEFITQDNRSKFIARNRTRVTLEEGHFARHHQRKKASVEVARRQKSSNGDQLSDGQEIDVDAIADTYDRLSQVRSTTGGKGMSKATMSMWEADIAGEADFDKGDGGGLGEPEVLYQYARMAHKPK